MPQMETLSLSSARDGLELPLLVCVPDGEVRAVVQFSHGMCENKERYAPFMEFLAAHGFACAIHDHRGHGAAALQRGELGYFGEDGANALVDDLHQVTAVAARALPRQAHLPLWPQHGLFGGARLRRALRSASLPASWSAEAPAGIPARPLGG